MKLRVLWGVDSTYFSAGLIIEAGVVISAAPILKWAEGKAREEVRAYAESRGWRMFFISVCKYQRKEPDV